MKPARALPLSLRKSRNWQTRHQKPPEEISSQINDIQLSTKDAVLAIEEIASTMQNVNSYTSTIATAVSQQGDATLEISSSVQKAAQGNDSSRCKY